MPAEAKSKHGEPWVRDDYGDGTYVNDATGTFVLATRNVIAADRAVTTVNACAGFERPEELPEIVGVLRKMVDDHRGIAPTRRAIVQELLARLDKPAEERKDEDGDSN